MSDFMDVGGINQRIAEFDRRHGESLYDSGWLLFADGAARESNPLGLMMEPPDDPWDRAKRKRRYRQVILERAVKAFHENKQETIIMARGNLSQQLCGPAASREATTLSLYSLQQAALSAKALFDQAEAEVKATEPDYLRQREQANLANRAANEKLLATVERIEI